jgi:aminopeptidase N
MAPIGGGMEHQTMTTMVHFWKNLNAHELGHQWFGDNVTCASWADIWVNEGFATYSQYLMLENMYPEERKNQMNDYHSAALQYLDGSVYVHTDTLSAGRLFDYRLTYAKGAAIINTMRFIINDDTKFFQGLKDYQTNFGGGTATGLDVKSSLESASGIDLTEAFEQWYFGQGYPTYSLKWNEIGHDLSLEIKQHPSGSFITQLFTNPLEISFERENDLDTTIRFEIDAATNTYFVPNVGRIKNVKEIDPYNWVINKSDTIIYDHLFEVPPSDGNVLPSIEVGPNPTDGKIDIVAQSAGSHTLKVIDSRGRMVMEKTFLKDTVLDISALAGGSYIFVISSEYGIIETTRIIKR